MSLRHFAAGAFIADAAAAAIDTPWLFHVFCFHLFRLMPTLLLMPSLRCRHIRHWHAADIIFIISPLIRFQPFRHYAAYFLRYYHAALLSRRFRFFFSTLLRHAPPADVFAISLLLIYFTYFFAAARHFSAGFIDILFRCRCRLITDADDLITMMPLRRHLRLLLHCWYAGFLFAAAISSFDISLYHDVSPPLIFRQPLYLRRLFLRDFRAIFSRHIFVTPFFRRWLFSLSRFAFLIIADIDTPCRQFIADYFISFLSYGYRLISFFDWCFDITDYFISSFSSPPFLSLMLRCRYASRFHVSMMFSFYWHWWHYFLHYALFSLMPCRQMPVALPLGFAIFFAMPPLTPPRHDYAPMIFHYAYSHTDTLISPRWHFRRSHSDRRYYADYLSYAAA